MGHGKYQKPRRVPAASWALVLLALLGLTVGGVVAYLSVSGGPVTNTFTADSPTDPSIAETMEDNVKSNVFVNVGNPGYAVYVRAAVVVTWQDAAGNVLAEAPKDTDYTISMNNTDWFEHGGFWYCKKMVQSPDGEADGVTPELIKECKPVASKGDYHLSVEIIAQTIQALGTTDGVKDANGNITGEIPAVQKAWGVYVTDDKELSPTAPATQ